MRKTVAIMKHYVYTDEESFKKDVEMMELKGYTTIERIQFSDKSLHGYNDDPIWKYTAFFMKRKDNNY
jgi:hypothetical protein